MGAKGCQWHRISPMSIRTVRSSSHANLDMNRTVKNVDWPEFGPLAVGYIPHPLTIDRLSHSRESGIARRSSFSGEAKFVSAARIRSTREVKCSIDNMAHVDRISNLPDPVLHDILSLLDSQEAVRTCMLSKRWNKLWVFTDSLDLSLPDFKTRRIKVERRFIRFVDTLLSRRDSSDLHAFRLFCEEDNFNVRHRSIKAWILYAVRHNAKVIQVSACLYRMLPQDIFTCESLQELILDISGLGRGIFDRGVNLPRLTKLHLCGIMSRNRKILRKLLSGCPALEDLRLNVCSIDMRDISSPQLKYLTIFSGLDSARIVSIRAPNLISLCLELRGDVLRASNFNEMPFLVNVSITVHDGTGFDAKCNILAAFPNVRNLKLCGSIMKDLLSVELPKCPTFFNLTDLHLSQLCRCFGSNLVDGMSEHLPNLKNLYQQKSTWCYQCQDDDTVSDV